MSKAVGDINGDGQPELIGNWATDEGSGSTYGYGTWVVLFSPFTLYPLDVSEGLPLGSADGHVWTVGQQTPDLDGDGLADLIDGDPYEDGIGAVSIWYGRDLKAAWEAREANRD